MYLPNFYLKFMKRVNDYLNSNNVDFSNEEDIENLKQKVIDCKESWRPLQEIITSRLLDYLKDGKKQKFEDMKDCIRAYVSSVQKYRLEDFPKPLQESLKDSLAAMKKTNTNINIVCDALDIQNFSQLEPREGFSSSFIQEYTRFLWEYQLFTANKLKSKYSLNEDQWLYIYNFIQFTLKIPKYFKN